MKCWWQSKEKCVWIDWKTCRTEEWKSWCKVFINPPGSRRDYKHFGIVFYLADKRQDKNLKIVMLDINMMEILLKIFKLNVRTLSPDRFVFDPVIHAHKVVSWNTCTVHNRPFVMDLLLFVNANNYDFSCTRWVWKRTADSWASPWFTAWPQLLPGCSVTELQAWASWQVYWNLLIQIRPKRPRFLKPDYPETKLSLSKLQRRYHNDIKIFNFKLIWPKFNLDFWGHGSNCRSDHPGDSETAGKCLQGKQWSTPQLHQVCLPSYILLKDCWKHFSHFISCEQLNCHHLPW